MAKKAVKVTKKKTTTNKEVNENVVEEIKNDVVETDMETVLDSVEDETNEEVVSEETKEVTNTVTADEPKENDAIVAEKKEDIVKSFVEEIEEAAMNRTFKENKTKKRLIDDMIGYSWNGMEMEF